MKELRDLWDSLNRKGEFDFISHLQPGEKWDQQEFHLTGIRFVERMVERIESYGVVKPSRASVVEIGCGVGRFLRPLSGRFKLVCGVDISAEMLKSAEKHCACLPNIVLRQTDGKTLEGIPDESVEYCVSAGVFQHITDFDAITSYVREALRVLKPDGLFLFQFEGNRTNDTGSGQVGAKITAAKLDAALSDAEFTIRELSIDPTDKVRNLVSVIQKRAPETAADKSFQEVDMIERAWMEDVYSDIRTKTHMHDRQAGPTMALTFYD